jgi:hypothetical protein
VDLRAARAAVIDPWRATACRTSPRVRGGTRVVFARGMRIAAAVIVCALAPPAAASPLPFIRDDGDSYVDLRLATGAGGGPGILQTSYAADLYAQDLLDRRYGVYAAMGGDHVVETDPEENPGPPPHYDSWSASTPYDLELGGLARLHDGGAALTASAGVSLPTAISRDVAYYGDAYTEMGVTDSVRAINRTALRAGLTPSVRGNNLFAAFHAGVDVVPTDRDPVRLDYAFDLGVETDGAGTTFAFGGGGYHVFGADSAANTFGIGLGIAHEIGRVQASFTASFGLSSLMEGCGALVAGARWAL